MHDTTASISNHRSNRPSVVAEARGSNLVVCGDIDEGSGFKVVFPRCIPGEMC